MIKKRGLGKSLDFLLSYTKPISTLTSSLPGKLHQLPIQQIQCGAYQPRHTIDPIALEELAASIRLQGIMQPLLVRPITQTPDRFEIIAGERRFRAAQLTALTTLPVMIYHVSDRTAIAMALVENIQRENLNPIEEGTALQRLGQEFNLTHQQIADAIGKSRATISNLLRLLTLPKGIQTLLETGQLEMGHARALIPLPQPLQEQVASHITRQALSVRKTEQLVKQFQSPPAQTVSPIPCPIDPDTAHLQKILSKQLKLRVLLKHSSTGKGKLIIHYHTLQELNQLLQYLQS